MDEYAYVECRDHAHAWSVDRWMLYEHRRTKKYPRSHQELIKALVCARCGMVRYDHVSPRSFELLYRRYAPPEGYAAPGSRKRDFTAYMNRIGLSKARRVAPEDQE